jgi:hypothetical protein
MVSGRLTAAKQKNPASYHPFFKKKEKQREASGPTELK